MWLYGGAMNATGKSLDWLRGLLDHHADDPADLLAEAARTDPGADGLVFLPYLAGERSPIWDERARGVFAGLTLAHGRGHLARAMLEGAAFALRHVAEPILAPGIEVREMVVSGGTDRDPPVEPGEGGHHGLPDRHPGRGGDRRRWARPCWPRWAWAPTRTRPPRSARWCASPSAWSRGRALRPATTRSTASIASCTPPPRTSSTAWGTSPPADRGSRAGSSLATVRTHLRPASAGLPGYTVAATTATPPSGLGAIPDRRSIGGQGPLRSARDPAPRER